MATPTTFFRAVWQAERQLIGRDTVFHRVGHDGWPNKEVVRFRSSQNLGFAGQDLVDRRCHPGEKDIDQHELTVDLMGLTGARGALPTCFTERVLQLQKQKSPATRDFLDLFNHRLISLFYRSWEKTQPAVHQEREDEDIFTHILKALTGCEENWQLFYGAAFARQARSASTLRAVLEDISGMPVEIRTLQGGWSPVEADDQTRLPDASRPAGQYATLGTAMLGRRAWMADQGVDVVFRPQNREQLVALLPGGAFGETLQKKAERLVSGHHRVRYRLQAGADHLPTSKLGQQGRLGADSFIGARPGASRMVEVSFKPNQGKD
ncbi:type VI secretion system baseplate subunit TssG [Marinobacteraceae bacterium S3BR75-40.1]